MPQVLSGAPPGQSGAPGLVADGLLTFGGVWVPAGGLQPEVAGARVSAALHPSVDCGARDISGRGQRVLLSVSAFLLGAQSALLGTPSSGTSRAKPFGLHAAL